MDNRQDNISESNLDDISIAILAELQMGIPLCQSPYRAMAEKLNIDMDYLLGIIHKCFEISLLREISPVFNASGLGYQSTLVAASVPDDKVASFVCYLNTLPGVSHNYGRKNEFNIWFTLALPGNDDVVGTDVFTPFLEKMKSDFGLTRIVSLPAIKMYKLKVQFGTASDSATVSQSKGASFDKVNPRHILTEMEIQLIRELQNGIPLCEYPFAVIAQRINVGNSQLPLSEDDIVTLINNWHSVGVLRRIAGRVRHYNLGYKYNAMVALDMSGLDIDSAGRVIAARGFVSHCYHRQRAPLWQYDLYAMVHADSQNKLDLYLADIIRNTNPVSHCVLPTTREYKKQAVRYFGE